MRCFDYTFLISLIHRIRKVKQVFLFHSHFSADKTPNSESNLLKAMHYFCVGTRRDVVPLTKTTKVPQKPAIFEKKKIM